MTQRAAAHMTHGRHQRQGEVTPRPVAAHAHGHGDVVEVRPPAPAALAHPAAERHRQHAVNLRRVRGEEVVHPERVLAAHVVLLAHLREALRAKLELGDALGVLVGHPVGEMLRVTSCNEGGIIPRFRLLRCLHCLHAAEVVAHVGAVLEVQHAVARLGEHTRQRRRRAAGLVQQLPVLGPAPGGQGGLALLRELLPVEHLAFLEQRARQGAVPHHRVTEIEGLHVVANVDLGFLDGAPERLRRQVEHLAGRYGAQQDGVARQQGQARLGHQFLGVKQIAVAGQRLGGLADHAGRVDAALGRGLFQRAVVAVGVGDDGAVRMREAALQQAPQLQELLRQQQVDVARRGVGRQDGRLVAVGPRFNVVDDGARALRQAKQADALRLPAGVQQALDQPVAEHAAALAADGTDEDARGAIVPRH